MRSLFLLALALCLPVQADTLGDLRARLSSLQAQTPVKASIQRQTWIRQGDAKSGSAQGSANAWAEEGPQGLKLFWSHDQLARAAQEAMAHEDGPAASPNVEAMTSLSPMEIVGYFNAVPRLIQDISSGKLVEERPDQLEGRTLRLLRFSLDPGPEIRKVLNKEAICTLSLWLDAEGWPVARQFKREGKGRLMMVASVEVEFSDEYRFTRKGDRIVVSSHQHHDRASGSVGKPRDSRQTTTLSYN